MEAIFMKRLLSGLICSLAGILFCTVLPTPGLALSDGAYTVSRQTSYVNPDTGNTVDGGTNIALGESMCASIVEDHILVEQVHGKTYMTIGIGLMSNVENVRIQVKGASGTYQNVAITQTGSCQRSGDVCNHYRFEAPSADCIISPVLYVTPMGRDVQFFVIPDISSAQTGTGNFVSEMISTTDSNTSASMTPVSSAPAQETETPQVTSTPVPSPSASEDVTPSETAPSPTSEAKGETGSKYTGTGIWIAGILLVVAVVGITVCSLWLRRKKTR